MSNNTPSTEGTESTGTGDQNPRQSDNSRNYGNQGRHGGRHRRNERRDRQQNTRFKGATAKLEDCTFGLHKGYAGAKRYSDNIKKLQIYAFKNCSTDQGILFGKTPSTPTVGNWKSSSWNWTSVRGSLFFPWILLYLIFALTLTPTSLGWT